MNFSGHCLLNGKLSVVLPLNKNSLILFLRFVAQPPYLFFRELILAEMRSLECPFQFHRLGTCIYLEIVLEFHIILLKGLLMGTVSVVLFLLDPK